MTLQFSFDLTYQPSQHALLIQLLPHEAVDESHHYGYSQERRDNSYRLAIGRLVISSEDCIERLLATIEAELPRRCTELWAKVGDGVKG
jgi:hypothetical protein